MYYINYKSCKNIQHFEKYIFQNMPDKLKLKRIYRSVKIIIFLICVISCSLIIISFINTILNLDDDLYSWLLCSFSMILRIQQIITTKRLSFYFIFL